MIRWEPHPVLKPPTLHEMARMEPEQLVELHRVYHEAIGNEKRDPLRYGFVPDHWTDAKGLLEEADELWVFGGNRCISGDTEVLDADTGRMRRVDQIKGQHWVLANAGGKVYRVLAGQPYIKGYEELYRVETDKGVFRASKRHLVLLADGSYLPVSALRQGYELSHLATNSGISHSMFHADDLRCFGTERDFRSDYHWLSRLRGELLHEVLEICRDEIPSPADVLEHTSSCDSIFRQLSAFSGCCTLQEMDGPGSTQPSSHPCAESGRLATQDDLGRFVVQSSGTLSRASCTPYGSASGSPVGRVIRGGDQLCSGESDRQLSTGQSGQPGSLYDCVLASRATVTVVNNIVKEEIGAVWDMDVPSLHNYYAGGAFHHNSSKSKFGAWLVMQALLENPGTRVFCWSQNDEASKLNQQPYLWEYMPVEFRRKQRGITTKIVYSKANGFTDKNFILPNGSQCIFKTYSQFQNDPSVIEGAELGASPGMDGHKFLNVGNWFDEYLLGPDLLETMRFRLATRDAKNLITFTPIDGYTETVRQIIQGGETVQWKEAELLDGELVPYVQKPKRANSRIIYFHSQMNPYGGYERLKKDLKGEKREFILVRAYGVPTKSAAGKFPRFTREWNVIPHDELPFVRDPAYAVTRYLVIDPAPVKPWTMIWVAVDRAGVHWVYREWPDISYGDWGEWGKNERSRGGPAQKPNGFGIKDYIDVIGQLENGEELWERLIDPRMGATSRQGKDGASTMIDDLCDGGMMVLPAPGLHEDEGLQALQNLLAWNTQKPQDALNRPHFMISDNCEQTIMCLQEYTGREGKDEAWKDFVDCCRYAAIAGLTFVDKNAAIEAKTGGY